MEKEWKNRRRKICDGKTDFWKSDNQKSPLEKPSSEKLRTEKQPIYGRKKSIETRIRKNNLGKMDVGKKDHFRSSVFPMFSWRPFSHKLINYDQIFCNKILTQQNLVWFNEGNIDSYSSRMDKYHVDEATKQNSMQVSVLDGKEYFANIGDSEGILVSVEY